MNTIEQIAEIVAPVAAIIAAIAAIFCVRTCTKLEEIRRSLWEK